MAFFKFPLPGQKRGDDKAPAAAKRESVEAMRQRAKHRLIGAAVLVAIGVVGFPLLFDTQPRPIAVDIPIEIPDKNQVQPLVIPAPPAAAPATSTAPANPAPAATTAASGPVTQVPLPASLGAKEEVVADTPKLQPDLKPDKAPAAPVAKAQSKPEPKPAPKPEPQALARASDGAKVEALLDGKSVAAVPAAASEAGRFVVQVGAFADAGKAHEARQKVEKAGLKTYTQVVETKDGKRIRVRAGPFASRAEADKAAGKIKGLQLAAAILTL
jgi:DedD protein